MRKIVLSVFTVLIMCFQLAAQSQRVTGTVTDAVSGEPVMGATVIVKGTQTAAVTGLNGEYSITVPANATLEFSFLGFATQEIAVAPGQTVLNVKLAEDNQQIEQVVVIGYGTARSVGSVTGSVSVVDADILNDKPVMNVADALSGQVSGMTVMTSSGEPSAGSSISIHGLGSISAGTEPLYVIDGMPSGSAQFLAMNANDIESMVTLKDASATSIYGSRAANGVIYITTKKGSRKDQDAQFRFSGSYGISAPVNNIYKPMGAYDLLEWQLWFDELNPENYNKYKALLDDQGPTDWFRYIYSNAPTYNAEFSVQGGSERISYYVSGSYMNQDGMAPGSGMERYTVRTNLSAQANSWLRLNMNLSAASTQTQQTMGQSDPETGAINMTATTNFPIYMPSYMTKYYYDEETGKRKQYNIFPNNFGDPYYIMEKSRSTTSSHYLNGNISVVLTPVRGLTITSLNGIDGAYSSYWANNYPSHVQNDNKGVRHRRYSQAYTLSTSNTIEYRFNPIKDFHNITLLVGQEGIDNYSDGFEAITTGQSDDRLMLLGNGTDITMNQVGESNSSYNMLSFFGRANYEYKNKYAVDLTIRNDASSRFGVNNRSALFYAIGGMWNVREEFFRDSRVLTDLRLRLTYGTQGNAAISNYAHLALIGGGVTYANSNGKYLASVGNDHLGWERQGLWNVSVEAGLFSWLELTASFYNRQTTGLLYDMPYPPSSGVTSRGENILAMVNRGVDIDLNATLFHNRDWNITFSTNFSYNYNAVTELYAPDAPPITMPERMGMYQVGKSAWSFYMPISMGVDPRDGAPMYDDGNGNPVKDANLAAYILLDKQMFAPYNGGFNLNASWKGLSLQANFAYQLDKWLVNGSRYFTENTTTGFAVQRPESMKNIWHTKGQITNLPRYGEQTTYSTAYLENASYLRLKNLSLSYQLPQSVLRKTGFIKGLKVSAIFRNLWTLTKYSGFDPEFNGNIQYGMYPNTRQYSAALELTF